MPQVQRDTLGQELSPAEDPPPRLFQKGDPSPPPPGTRTATAYDALMQRHLKDLKYTGPTDLPSKRPDNQAVVATFHQELAAVAEHNAAHARDRFFLTHFS